MVKWIKWAVTKMVALTWTVVVMANNATATIKAKGISAKVENKGTSTTTTVVETETIKDKVETAMAAMSLSNHSNLKVKMCQPVWPLNSNKCHNRCRLNQLILKPLCSSNNSNRWWTNSSKLLCHKLTQHAYSRWTQVRDARRLVTPSTASFRPLMAMPPVRSLACYLITTVLWTQFCLSPTDNTWCRRPTKPGRFSSNNPIQHNSKPCSNSSSKWLPLSEH